MDAFEQYFLNVIRNHYADFEGRARRKEYWMFYLFTIAIYFAIVILAAILSSIADVLGLVGWLAYAVFALGVIVPGVAVTVRRLHDTGKSGWLALLGLVPLLGLVLLYFMVIEGDAGPNEYGPDPKDAYGSDLSSVLDTY